MEMPEMFGKDGGRLMLVEDRTMIAIGKLGFIMVPRDATSAYLELWSLAGGLRLDRMELKFIPVGHPYSILPILPTEPSAVPLNSKEALKEYLGGLYGIILKLFPEPPEFSVFKPDTGSSFTPDRPPIKVRLMCFAERRRGTA